MDEAIEEMENVGHDFFAFRDMESDEIQVRMIAQLILALGLIFECKNSVGRKFSFGLLVK